MARMTTTAGTLPALGADSPFTRWAELARRFSLSTFPIVLVLVIWDQATCSRGTVCIDHPLTTPFLLPNPIIIAERIWSDVVSGDLVTNVGLTLYRAFFGFIVASVTGVALGILIARNNFVHWFFDPIISVGFPMPKIAFLPIFMLWFGLYDTSKIALIIFDATFPVVTATIAGAQGVDRYTLWSARMLGASERRLLWEIIVPAAFPTVMTGLQIALPISLIIAIVTEMIMGGPGLGGAMIAASRFADSPGVFAGIIEIAVAGFCVVKGMAMLRRRLLIWHPEAEEPTTV
jgi:ABC-type nitrate/sulfonate/bicarbonate transport system permease component